MGDLGPDSAADLQGPAPTSSASALPVQRRLCDLAHAVLYWCGTLACDRQQSRILVVFVTAVVF